MSITYCLGIIDFQNFCFSIVFILWLAFFASQHTKSMEKHKLFRLIAPKQVKTGMPCTNKILELRCFFRFQCQFFSLGQKLSHFRVCLQTVNSAIAEKYFIQIDQFPARLQSHPSTATKIINGKRPINFHMCTYSSKEVIFCQGAFKVSVESIFLQS